MTRTILILVVYFSFLGVFLAQEKVVTIHLALDIEKEEHPRSIYISSFPHQGLPKTDFSKFYDSEINLTRFSDLNLIEAWVSKPSMKVFRNS